MKRFLTPVFALLITAGMLFVPPLQAKPIHVPVHIHMYCPVQEPSKLDLELQIQELNNGFVTSPFRFDLASVDMTPANIGGRGELNLYIVDMEVLGIPASLLGKTVVPWAPESGDGDQVIVACGTLPRGRLYPYNTGETAVHEVGHWFGLEHKKGTCFKNRCNFMDTDMVDAVDEGSFSGQQIEQMKAVALRERGLGK